MSRLISPSLSHVGMGAGPASSCSYEAYGMKNINDEPVLEKFGLLYILASECLGCLGKAEGGRGGRDREEDTGGGLR